MSPEEDRTRDAVDSEPKHYQLSYSGPKRDSNPVSSAPEADALTTRPTRRFLEGDSRALLRFGES